LDYGRVLCSEMKANELLRRYVDDRSEPTFEELVKQHIDLVYSAALRQVNGDVPAAQDVTQAVFTDLARKAPRLLNHTSLAGWLYTSTRYLAGKVRRAEHRRRAYEEEAHHMNQLLQPDPDSIWQEMRPLLDDAMHDLSAIDREAVLMRYFERLPLADIGARLGLKENAVHMRIERALDRLRAALARRGVTSTVTALSALLTGRAVGGAPARLATRVSRAAFGAAAAGSGLGWGLLKLAGLINGKALVAVVGVALLAGLVFLPQLLTKTGGAAPVREVSNPTGQHTAQAGAATGPVIAGPLGAASDRKPAESNVMALHVVASATGKPIAGATLAFWFQENNASNGTRPSKEITADKFGVCEIPVSRGTVTLLGLASRTDGYVDTAIAWQSDHGEIIPRQYTWRLDDATPIGGQILDENGKPVAGADVTVWTSRNSAEDSLSPQISTVATEDTLTDAEGRWHIARFAQKAISSLNFQASHPDFVAETGFAFMNNPEAEQPLLAGAYVYKLHHGLSASGIVVDTAGQPVSGVKVTAISGGHPRVTTNQPDGTFTLNGLPAGPSQINAEAHGFALTTTNLDLMCNEKALRLELSGGNLLRLRVVDTNGNPVPNAAVSLNFNRAADNSRFGGNGVPGQFRKQTGTDGRITWDSAPDGPLFFGIHAFGYQRAQNVEVTGDGEEHLVTLHAARTISGNAHDAVLHQPIATFRIFMGVVEPRPSEGGTNVQWNRSRTFHDGTFSFRENDIFGAIPRQYKFEADGYAPFVTRVVQPDEGDVLFDILLYPSAGTSITVLSPDGRTATNAFIGLDMPGARLDLKPGGFDPTPGVGVLSVDDAGRFVLPPDDTVTRIIAASPEGYAESTPTALAASPSMRLQPWGRLEGTYLSGGKPAVGRVLRLRQFDYPAFDRFRFFTAETDADGHFVFPRVPPGQFNLFRIEKQETIRGTVSYFRPVQNPALTVRLGETTTVPLVLYKVTARLRLPPGVEMETNWNMSAEAANTQNIAGEQVSESLKESGDGTWLAEDLPAGDYTLEASVQDSAASEAFKARLQSNKTFTVPGNTPTGTLDLGEIMLQPVQ
jgi:RNA polymerase sigma factor (sigma-70 family)